MRALLVAFLVVSCSPAETASPTEDAAVDTADGATTDGVADSPLDTAPMACPSGSDLKRTDAGGCNDIAPGRAMEVKPVTAMGDAPKLKGGTLLDGTYVLTEWKLYGGLMLPPEAALTQTWILSGGTKATLVEQSGARAIYSTTTTGTSMKDTQLCGGTASATYDYEVTSTTLTIAVGDGIQTDVRVYKRVCD